MQYTINVTAEDIENGVALSCKHCPVSVALRRISGAYWAHTDQTEIRIGKNDVLKSDSYPTPKEVKEFITAFDRDKEVAPFTFQLRALP